MRSLKALALTFALVTAAATMSHATHVPKHHAVTAPVASATPVPICPTVRCPTAPAPTN